MLQIIREKIQGWIAGVLIGLVAIGFVVWGLEYYIDQGGGQKKTAAEVNGEKISEQDLMQTYRQLVQRQQAATGGAELSPQMQKQIKQFALQGMISRTVMIQAARNAGFRISKAQVEALITQAPDFRVNGRFSRARFEQIVSANFGIPSRFFAAMKANLMLAQLRNGILQSSFVLPSEWEQAFALYKQTRDFAYYLLPVSRFKVSVSAQDVQNYYQQNQSKFKTPLKVKVSYILLSPKILAENVKVSDAQIEQYYQTNKMNFSTPKRWQIQMVMFPLAQNASQNDIDAATAKLNLVRADLAANKTSLLKLANDKSLTISKKTVNQDQLAGVMAAVLPSLKENSLSQVVRMPSGVALVKVDKITLPSTKALAAVKENIKKRIIAQQVSGKFSELSNELSNLTFTNPTTLDSAAKNMGLKVVTSDFITKQGLPKGILSNKNILNAVFSKEVLEQGNNSYPISLKDGSVIVVRVAKKQAPRMRSLKEVAAKIKAQLEKNRAESEAGLAAYKIQQAIQAGESKAQIMQKYKVSYHPYSDITAQDKKISAAILREVFSLKPLQKGKVAGSVLLSDGNYAIIEVQSVKLAQAAKATVTERKVLQQQMQNYTARIEYEFLAKSAMSQAKIKNYLDQE